jgi:hypothetical protein
MLNDAHQRQVEEHDGDCPELALCAIEREHSLVQFAGAFDVAGVERLVRWRMCCGTTAPALPSSRTWTARARSPRSST